MIFYFNPIGAGSIMWPHFFQMSISLWNDKWLFLIHYKLSENPNFSLFFHSVFGWSRRCSLIVSPHTHATFKSPATVKREQYSTKTFDTYFICFNILLSCYLHFYIQGLYRGADFAFDLINFILNKTKVCSFSFLLVCRQYSD